MSGIPQCNLFNTTTEIPSRFIEAKIAPAIFQITQRKYSQQPGAKTSSGLKCTEHKLMNEFGCPTASVEDFKSAFFSPLQGEKTQALNLLATVTIEKASQHIGPINKAVLSEYQDKNNFTKN